MTNVQMQIQTLENRFRRYGVSIAEFVREAGVAYSTWTRWRAGSHYPTMRAWEQCEAAALRVIKRAKEG
jgi:hypothetical protein